jgi:hypothetical protein
MREHDKLIKQAEFRIDYVFEGRDCIAFFVPKQNPVWKEFKGRVLFGNYNDCGDIYEIIDSIDELKTARKGMTILYKKKYASSEEWDFAKKIRTEYVRKYNKVGKKLFGKHFVEITANSGI